MSEQDRPAPTDAGSWPTQDDPEATRVVPRNDQAAEQGATVTPEGPDAGVTQVADEEAPATGTPNVGTPDADAPGAGGPAFGSDSAGSFASSSDPAVPAAGNLHAPYDPSADTELTSTIPPAAFENSPATAYIGAPTMGYSEPQAGYSYQQPAYGSYGSAESTGSGPQAVAAPATANVILPPVRMPKAESRVALNILGSIVGLILVAGGLTLIALFAGKMRSVDTTSLGSGTVGDIARASSIDTLALVLTIVGAVLVAVAALVSAWASWAAILPGFLLAAASVWAMVTTGADSGAVLIDKGTSWAFKKGELAAFCASGSGLLVGLLLLFAGLAAVFLRAGVRRTVRQQLESIQS